MKSSVYTGFYFIEGSVYTGFYFIEGLVYTGFYFIEGLVLTGFTINYEIMVWKIKFECQTDAM